MMENARDMRIDRDKLNSTIDSALLGYKYLPKVTPEINTEMVKIVEKVMSAVIPEYSENVITAVNIDRHSYQHQISLHLTPITPYGHKITDYLYGKKEFIEDKRVEVNYAEMEDKFLVFKHSDLDKYLTLEESVKLCSISNKVQHGREQDGKVRQNNYLVINTDEPYAPEVVDILKAHGDWGKRKG